MDINSAFLNATIEAGIYMKQPEGFIDPETPNHVLHLLKSLYRL